MSPTKSGNSSKIANVTGCIEEYQCSVNPYYIKGYRIIKLAISPCTTSQRRVENLPYAVDTYKYPCIVYLSHLQVCLFYYVHKI